MGRFGSRLAALALLLGHGSVAWAGCTKDTDCKGVRICTDGQCVDPGGTHAGSTRSSSPSHRTRGMGDGGWALAGGIVGISAFPIVTGLALGAGLTKDEQIPSLPMGAVGTVGLAVFIPVVAAGGSSARRGTTATGLLGLRIPGWILYGLSMLNATALVVGGILEEEPPGWQIGLTAAMGDLALIGFVVDAFVSHAEARKAQRSAAILNQEIHEQERPAFVVAPFVSPIRRENAGASGAVMGLAAAF